MTNNPTKRCSACKHYLPLTSFSQSKQSPDGKQYTCIECKREYLREHKRASRHKQRVVPNGPALDTTFARPSTINKLALPLYEPAKDQAYYRNDGHKHIKSRGVLC